MVNTYGGTFKFHGKRYYRIGRHNQYVKAENFYKLSSANSGSSSSSSSVSKHETKPSKGKDVKPTTSNKKIAFYNYGDPYTLTSKATLYDKNGQH